MKTALITGASGGIGRSLVRAYAAAGYRVAIHYWQNRRGAQEAQREAIAVGAAAACFQADLSDGEQARRMAAQAADELGEISHLINNAGHSEQQLFTEIREEEWKHMFAVHVHGAYYCCQSVLPAMIRQKEGVIINISSIWGTVGASCEVHYSAAKAALVGMTKALAKELGPSGIRVNAIAPGIIDTRMNTDLIPEALDALAKGVALGRLGHPEEVAALALFLSGEGASYITGQILGADGGFL